MTLEALYQVGFVLGEVMEHGLFAVLQDTF